MMNRNHNMKRNIERLAAGALAAAVGFGTVACGAAGTSSKSSSKDTLKATKEKLEDTMEVSTSFGDKADEDAEKVETVYVSADADGSAKDVTVSNWLRNYSGKDKIDDKSDLTDIKNVKGNQKFEKGSDGALTWDADGKDVFYQGKTKDSLPVGVKVSYKLDGKDIDPKDLAGKSGKVTIRFDYTNTAKTTVNVDGQDKEMTVPFAMISGMVLPSDHFSNITVTNGKVVSDADNNIVMGVALPGLSDALSIDRSKLDDLGVNADTTIPDYVEITADAKDFELGLTMTMASANVLSDLGFSDYDNSDAVNKIGDDMDKLQSSMQQLIDGGKKVSDGTAALKEGSAALKDGVNAYTAGVGQLTAGAKKLNDSISTLTDGTQKLSDGVKLLKQKLSQAKSSDQVKQIQILYQSYQAIYNELTNTNGEFAKVYASLSKLSDLQNSVSKVKPETYQEGVNLAKGLIHSFNPQMQEPELTQNAELITRKAIKDAIDGNETFTSDFMKQGGNFQKLYLEPAAVTLSSATAANGIKAADTKYKTRGYEDIKSESDLDHDPVNKAWLAATGMTKTEWLYLSEWSRVTDDPSANTGAEYLVKYNAFMRKFAMIQTAYQSVQSKLTELSNGVDQLDAGTSQLLNGISNQLAPGVLQLYNGAAKLNSNSAALNKGADQLYDGAKQLADGSTTLSNGLVQFNDEGIAKLSEAFTGEVSQFADQLKAVDDAGKSYTTFSGKADDMNSSVKFIIETDEISKDSKK